MPVSPSTRGLGDATAPKLAARLSATLALVWMLVAGAALAQDSSPAPTSLPAESPPESRTCPAQFPIPAALRMLRCDQRTWVCECDEAGNLQREVEDYDFDGNPDFVVSYLYDGERLARVVTDTDADGSADGGLKLYYDPAGRLVRIQGDPLGRGVSSAVVMFYDEAGALVGADSDVDGDGSLERPCTFSPPCPAPYERCAPIDCP